MKRLPKELQASRRLEKWTEEAKEQNNLALKEELARLRVAAAPLSSLHRACGPEKGNKDK